MIQSQQAQVCIVLPNCAIAITSWISSSSAGEARSESGFAGSLGTCSSSEDIVQVTDDREEKREEKKDEPVHDSGTKIAKINRYMCLCKDFPRVSMFQITTRQGAGRKQISSMGMVHLGLLTHYGIPRR